MSIIIFVKRLKDFLFLAGNIGSWFLVLVFWDLCVCLFGGLFAFLFCVVCLLGGGGVLFVFIVPFCLFPFPCFNLLKFLVKAV